MALIKVADAGGDTMDLVEFDGYRTCTFFQPPEVVGERLKNFPNFSCREDDIFICAPIKSGTHWTWEIISMLVNGNTETIPKSKVENMLEAFPWDTLAALPSPRVLNTHLHYKYLPREMKEKRCKIVLPLRNLKDVAVSAYNHVSGIACYNYSGKWNNYLPMFLEGQYEYQDWFEYVKEWEELLTYHPDLPIHLVYYEDLKEDSLGEIKRLGKFLGVENKEHLYERIAEKCKFSNMQKDKAIPYNFTFKTRDGFSFYRKGEIGDWKNYFTVAQSERFDKIYSEKMKDSKLKFRYEYTA